MYYAVGFFSIPVGCNVKMPPEMLHKQTHVAEMSLTDAALQTWNTLFRSGHVDMNINLVLLTKQDVVNRANDLENLRIN